MNSLKSTFAKKDIQNKFNISLATVNNWIKTGIIPSPTNGYYTKDVYSNLIKSIEKHSNKLQSRANRSYQNSSDIIFLGIKNKERKELLVNLVNEYKNSNLSP
ncbi:MAG: restriction endonuclease, partial [Treponema sp.]|nr:restriction endonuclease [Treponema sp.]